MFVERVERLATIRSTSALPVPGPSSQPPTPTRLAGTGSSFEFEDRGDLIKFYNSVSISFCRLSVKHVDYIINSRLGIPQHWFQIVIDIIALKTGRNRRMLTSAFISPPPSPIFVKMVPIMFLYLTVNQKL